MRAGRLRWRSRYSRATPPIRARSAQIDKVKKRFALAHVVLVGDRGMITQARIDAEIAPGGSTGSGVRAPAIRELRMPELQMSCSTTRHGGHHEA